MAKEDDDPVLAGLNPQQRAAAAHGDGPLLIVAGAGTGKTTTLAARVAHLIREGADPAGILLLTFTRRASQEMLDRVAKRLSKAMGEAGERAARQVWGGTFHGVAARLLRVYHAALGLPQDFSDPRPRRHRGPPRPLPRPAQSAELGARFPKKRVCAAVLGRVSSSGATVTEVLEAHFPHLMQHEPALRRLFDLYDEAKGEQNLLDFDDLLLFWEALAADPKAGPALRSPGSPACWWTSTRTRTSCRPGCWKTSRRPAAASRRWGTTRRRSTASAAPPCGTSLISAKRSPTRRSSPSKPTTAAPPPC